MDAPLEKIVYTDPQGIYSVIVLHPPVTVYALRRNGARQKMGVWKEEKAYQFVAVTGRTVFAGGKIGRIEQVFDATAVSNEPEQEVVNAQGEPLVEPDDITDDSCAVCMAHAVWCAIPSTAKQVCVNPSDKETLVLSQQLLFSPSSDLSPGWLTSSVSSKPIYWPFGEPYFVAGYRYCITLVQLPDMIVANMTPLGAV